MIRLLALLALVAAAQSALASDHAVETNADRKPRLGGLGPDNWPGDVGRGRRR